MLKNYISKKLRNAAAVVLTAGMLYSPFLSKPVYSQEKPKNNIEQVCEERNYIPKEPEVSLQKNSLEEELYKVKKGDNLWNLAKEHNIEDWQKLAEYNNLNDTNIKPGQELRIPKIKEVIEFIEYKVEKGDSLIKIAKENNIKDWKEILEYNKLNNPDELKIGQTLKIQKRIKNIEDKIQENLEKVKPSKTKKDILESFVPKNYSSDENCYDPCSCECECEPKKEINIDVKDIFKEKKVPKPCKVEKPSRDVDCKDYENVEKTREQALERSKHTPTTDKDELDVNKTTVVIQNEDWSTAQNVKNNETVHVKSNLVLKTAEISVVTDYEDATWTIERVENKDTEEETTESVKSRRVFDNYRHGDRYCTLKKDSIWETKSDEEHEYKNEDSVLVRKGEIYKVTIKARDKEAVIYVEVGKKSLYNLLSPIRVPNVRYNQERNLERIIIPSNFTITTEKTLNDWISPRQKERQYNIEKTSKTIKSLDLKSDFNMRNNRTNFSKSSAKSNFSNKPIKTNPNFSKNINNSTFNPKF